jgi:hypothetical protein
MQRPIIVRGAGAAVARPPERLKTLGRSGAGLGSSAGRGLCDPAAAQASRAYQDSFDPAPVRRPHFLQIGLPSALGLVVGMAYVVAHRWTFSANRAMSHILVRVVGVD